MESDSQTDLQDLETQRTEGPAEGVARHPSETAPPQTEGMTDVQRLAHERFSDKHLRDNYTVVMPKKYAMYANDPQYSGVVHAIQKAVQRGDMPPNYGTTRLLEQVLDLAHGMHTNYRTSIEEQTGRDKAEAEKWFSSYVKEKGGKERLQYIYETEFLDKIVKKNVGTQAAERLRGLGQNSDFLLLMHFLGVRPSDQNTQMNYIANPETPVDKLRDSARKVFTDYTARGQEIPLDVMRAYNEAFRQKQNQR